MLNLTRLGIAPVADIEKEIMWAVSGTGEDFQCVDASFAREQQAKIERLRKGIQDYLDGNYDNARKLRAEHGPQAKCSHGRFYYEECGECIDRHFSLLLGETVHATPEQGRGP